jgi:molybdopterin-guanine dinucleotide biosynthesis protein A
MGRDKALLPFRGGSLAGAVAQTIERAAGSVVVVGRPDFPGYPAIPDRYPDEGPLGGILTALEHTSAEWNLIVACDMPELDADFLRGLLDRAEASGSDALIPYSPRPEPLCAVYHRRAKDALAREFARGVRKIMVAMETLDVQAWDTAEVTHFQNVNTPEDWAGYAAE